MEKMTVCFSGYRPAKMPKGGDETTIDIIRIKKYLRRSIQNAVDKGYTHFISGMAAGFDIWAGEAVADIRDACGGDITLECALPFRGQGERLKGKEKERYFNLFERADNITLVNENYFSGCFHARNRYMIDCSRLLITYFDGQKGGTAYTVNYAEKKGLSIINIYNVDCV